MVPRLPETGTLPKGAPFEKIVAGPLQGGDTGKDVEEVAGPLQRGTQVRMSEIFSDFPKRVLICFGGSRLRLSPPASKPFKFVPYLLWNLYCL